MKHFIERFDYFIIDLWGVLHDGTHPYAGAADCLKYLKLHGKQIILLSNAPRKASKAQSVLDDLGFSRRDYDHILTSGQAVYDYLTSSDKYGKKYYYIGPDKDLDLMEGSEYQMVSSASEAHFALVTGLDNHPDDLQKRQAQARDCLEQSLPLICANPDNIVIKQSGEKILCAGVIAQFYQDNGGAVEFFGKPHKHVYQRCMSLFNIRDTSKICAIGDSLHTDIAGANEMNIFSILVAGGILSNELMDFNGELLKQDELDKILEELSNTYNAKADDVIARFAESSIAHPVEGRG